MNKTQKFLEAVANWNGGDLDDSPISASDVIKTHEPVSSFVSESGKYKNTDLFVRDGYQIKAGLRSGFIWAMQFDGFCLVATSAEGKIN